MASRTTTWSSASIKIDSAAITLQHCQLLIQDAGGRAPNTLRVSLGLGQQLRRRLPAHGLLRRLRDRAPG